LEERQQRVKWPSSCEGIQERVKREALAELTLKGTLAISPHRAPCSAAGMEEEDEVIVISDSEAEAPAPKRQRGAEADDVSIVVPPAPVLAAAGAESDDEVVLLGVTGEVRGDDASSHALTTAHIPCRTR